MNYYSMTVQINSNLMTMNETRSNHSDLKSLSEPALNARAYFARAKAYKSRKIEENLSIADELNAIVEKLSIANELNAIADERNRRTTEKMKDFLSRHSCINHGLNVVSRERKMILPYILEPTPIHLRIV